MKYKGRDVKSSDLAISAAVGGAASYSLTKTLDVVSKGSLHHRNNIISAGLLLGIASLNTAAQQDNSDQDESCCKQNKTQTVIQ